MKNHNLSAEPTAAKVRDVRARMRNEYAACREVITRWLKTRMPANEEMIRGTGVNASLDQIRQDYQEQKAGLVRAMVAKYSGEMDRAMEGERPKPPSALEIARIIMEDAQFYAPGSIQEALRLIKSAMAEPLNRRKCQAWFIESMMGLDASSMLFQAEATPLEESEKIMAVTGFGPMTAKYLVEEGWGLSEAIPVACEILDMRVNGLTVGDSRFVKLMVEGGLDKGQARSIFEARDRLHWAVADMQNRRFADISLSTLAELHNELGGDHDAFESFVEYCELNLPHEVCRVIENEGRASRHNRRHMPNLFAVYNLALLNTFESWVGEARNSGSIPTDILDGLSDKYSYTYCNEERMHEFCENLEMGELEEIDIDE